MLKKFAFALIPVALLAVNVNAGDDLNIDAASITDADVAIVDDMLDIDVDDLTGDMDEQQEDAIEACFRRYGYSYRSWGHSHYFRSCYSYCRPMYTYHTIRHCAPVMHTCFRPVYTYYWGCH